MTTVCLSLFRFPTVTGRLWVLGQMALARLSLRQIPGLKFYKLLGTGSDAGFTPSPNTAVWGILTVWDDEATARERLAKEWVFNNWRSNASENWTCYLEPTAAKGKWGGKVPFETGKYESNAVIDGPMVALTRAQIRFRKTPDFWQRVPKIQEMVAADPNVIFKIGLGEWPVLYQATFSIWPDSTTMNAFARGNTPHGIALRDAYKLDWLVEYMFARFRLIGSEGTWEGKDPLERLKQPAPKAPKERKDKKEAA
ncbi:spheroidene monooxygenase [Candidatus Falkowbacteria bacterium]|nr:spheroidene monooxygenase [Candidatus Falkowbacteria bacterium]